MFRVLNVAFVVVALLLAGIGVSAAGSDQPDAYLSILGAAGVAAIFLVTYALLYRLGKSSRSWTDASSIRCSRTSLLRHPGPRMTSAGNDDSAVRAASPWPGSRPAVVRVRLEA
jgi:hypothetical protein